VDGTTGEMGAAIGRVADDLRGRPPRRILIVRLSALGDVLHCLPALSALRSLYPGARIDWACESLGASLLEGHPDLDRVLRFPRKEISRDFLRGDGRDERARAALERFLTSLREESFDLVIDLQGNLRSALVARLARGRNRVGHHREETKEHPWLLAGVRPTRPAGAVHRVEKNLHLVRALGFDGPAPSGRLIPDAEAREHYRPLAEAGGALPTILHPFVSAFGRFKEWPPERWAGLARALADRGHRIWVTAAPEDFGRRDRLLAACGDAACPAPATRSARELAALLSLARIVVAADTGPAHLAAFTGVPVVGLYGPKDPATYGPWSPRAAVRRGAVPCAPCRLRRCDHAICMQEITVAAVLEGVEESLAREVPIEVPR
jgi:heptosyltransferase-1